MGKNDQIIVRQNQVKYPFEKRDDTIRTEMVQENNQNHWQHSLADVKVAQNLNEEKQHYERLLASEHPHKRKAFISESRYI